MANGTIPGETYTGPGSTGSDPTPPSLTDMDPAHWISMPAQTSARLTAGTPLVSPEELASWTGQAMVTRIVREG